MLAKILPFACISLRTERLPASSEWMIAAVDSRPPRSRMDILLEPLFATYAYLPETKTENGPDPVVGVLTVTGEFGLDTSMMDMEDPPEFATYA